jgi:hypothetical protein
VYAMTVADQIRAHQTRCQPHVLTLRMLACGEAGAGLAIQVAAEVVRATTAIVAEAEAAGREALVAAAGSRGESEAGTFLQVRLDRLAMTADEAITAARGGDDTGLRSQLRRFEALTSAIWAVQYAVYGPLPHPRQPADEPSRHSSYVAS